MSEDAVKRRTKPAAETTEAAEAAEIAFEEAAGLLSVDGIEVTQVVQDMGHSVPLIAGKATVVRVYLSRPEGGVVTVRGEISVRRSPTGTPHKIPSLATARVSPTQNGRLRTKRHDLRLSLNFLLPASLTAAGRAFIQISSLADATTAQTIACSDCAEKQVEVRFVDGAPLRVRLIKMRYRTDDAPNGHVPRSLDVSLFRSWLGRAYPVSRIVFSQATVDTNIRPPFRANTSDKTNAQLTTIRRLDVSNGTDQRTHYYGMVYDARDFFMRGSASALPDTPDPTAVASGPTGDPEGGWDTDGSYGDWYGGHELAHTFGRLHPGFCDGNTEDDNEYPFTDGQLSNSNAAFVGFDVGDASLGIPMRALPGPQWHDVMTYCDQQWMSSYTYDGIRVRLLAEDALGPTPAPGESDFEGAAETTVTANELEVNMASGDFISVVAEVNLTEGTGNIRYVNPVSRALSPASAGSAGFELRVLDAAGQALGTYPAPVKVNSCADPAEDRTGIVDALIPANPAARQIELLYNGQVLDTFRSGGAVPEVSNLRREASTESALSFTWDDATAAMAEDEASASNVTYNVQVSTDEGQTWQTVAIGRTSPDATIDRTQFEPGERVTVRVVATDGFTSTVAETETFSVDEPEH
ncbi:MAG TPA: hypothetical protein VLB46_12960 [Pyrinomonadaceae bacterium]|nr:hypothetical protein [Pyrinomonadaceae bacterium]